MIESGKLPFEENLWLRGLAKDLNPAAAGSILKESRKREGTKLKAYLYALVTANLKAVREVVAMTAGMRAHKGQTVSKVIALHAYSVVCFFIWLYNAIYSGVISIF
ncbi:MAG: hypothetical protein LBG14_01810 [Treponema sp.]|nr:hypothetical protein [Treponema sp.]